jgi:hypothetical protein
MRDHVGAASSSQWRETSVVAHGGWFAYEKGGGAAHLGSFRRYRLRPFHTVELNAVGWAVLLCAALPMVMLLLFVARWSVWLSIVASVVVTVAVAIVLDRRKEAASWVGCSTDLNETELQTVVAELQAPGIDVELSRRIPYDRPESWGENELELRYRHRDRGAGEQALAARRRDH